MNNILSIDVESWVHFYMDIFQENKKYTSFERKNKDNGYVRDAVRQTLQLLEKYNRSTFPAPPCAGLSGKKNGNVVD